MGLYRLVFWKAALATAAVLATFAAHALSDPKKPAAEAHPTQVAGALRLVPMAFESNAGQYATDIRFVARGLGYAAGLRDSGHVLKLTAPDGRGEKARAAVISVRFAGAKPQVPVGRDELPHKSHYLIGSDARGFRIDVPSFRAVEFPEVYPGIDLLYYGNQTQLEYDFIVRPGADPSAIRLEYSGAKPSIDKAGDLVLRTAAGEIKQLRPVAYQEVEGARKRVSARYVRIGANAVKIRLGSYDPTRPLVIDPVLSYSTYIGGKASDEALAIAVDASGNTYVAGTTSSSDFPTTSGVHDGNLGRNDVDAYVAKLNPTATALVFATFLGGSSGSDRATSVQVDAAGNVYLTGRTSGASNNFPTTTGAYQRTPSASGGDGFVTKLDPAGKTLIYSTYLNKTSPARMAVDIYGQAYVTGSAFSGFVTTPGVFRPFGGGSGTDAFVLKLDAAGSAPVYSTYVPGAYQPSYGVAIAVDRQGNAHMAAHTESYYMPTVFALQERDAPRDGYVAKLNASGTALLFGSYIGDVGDDYITSIAVDGAGAIYVGGQTASTTLPVVNALQATPGAGFIAKIKPDYSGYAFFTYLGPPATTYAASGVSSIAVDADGFVTATGVTVSPFPLQDPLPDSPPSGLYVARLDPSGTSLVYSTFIGNAPTTSAVSSVGPFVTLDSSGNAFVAGNVSDPSFPTTAGVLRRTLGAQDGFALKLTSKRFTVSIASNMNPAAKGDAVTLSSTVQDQGTPVLNGSVSFLVGDAVIGTAPIVNGTATLITTVLPVGVLPLRAVYSLGGDGGASPALYVSVNQAGVCN